MKLGLPSSLVGDSRVWRQTGSPPTIPGWTPARSVRSTYQSRYLSDSGRLFFNSADALVPSDSNGTEDVYQYEPPQGPRRHLHRTEPHLQPRLRRLRRPDLLRHPPEESAFLDASESGDDVFFLTASQLTPRDIDTALDVYDARADGGEAAARSNPPICEGDGCQHPASRRPIDPTPGTSTLHGAGNLVAVPKGKVKNATVRRQTPQTPEASKTTQARSRKRANTNRGGQKMKPSCTPTSHRA